MNNTPSSSPHHCSASSSTARTASWPAAFYSGAQLRHGYHDPALASLAYRLPHLPLHQQQSPDCLIAPPLQQRQRIQPPQLVQHPPPTGVHHRPAYSARHIPLSARRRTRQALAMASLQQQGTTDEELAELQKLSNEYEPEVTGPLVGQLQPSTAITTQYASADPVFRAKTAALPQKFSHYRSIRGDGRCGWRAIAFGYFEALIHYADANRFLEEETRLRSSSNVLNLAGFDPMLYEDFADETFELLRKISQALQAGNAEDVLLEAFNDETVQNFIMTHLKTLTAAWMKTRPQEYEPWLPDQTVEEYCNAFVMPIGAEIDNVGLSALKDAFLSPAGITLEVLYLDRSEGTEANTHRFPPVNYGGFDIGTIRLLYRPGHYDLLYKLRAIPAPAVPAPATVPTYLQYSSCPDPGSDLGVPDHLMGMPYVGPQEGWTSYNNFGDMDYLAHSAAVHNCTPAVPPPSIPPLQPHVQHHSNYAHTPTHLVPPPLHMPQDLALRMVSPQILSPHPGLQHQLGGPFRPSAWELKPEFVQATSQTPLQTAIFRNSHFNTAHFMNENFQPEEWHPEENDYVTSTGRPSRYRSSG